MELKKALKGPEFIRKKCITRGGEIFREHLFDKLVDATASSISI